MRMKSLQELKCESQVHNSLQDEWDRYLFLGLNSRDRDKDEVLHRPLLELKFL